MTISERYAQVRKRVDEAAARSGRDPSDVTLLAVTKTHSYMMDLTGKILLCLKNDKLV